MVAEIDNRVVGFVLGRAGEFEFGLPGTIAWIENRGSTGDRGQGIAQELVGQFAESAKGHGIKTIFTLVGNGQDEMRHFLADWISFTARCCTNQKELSG